MFIFVSVHISFFLKNSEVIEVFNRVGIILKILPNITKNEF